MAGSRAYDPAGGADRPPVGRRPRLMEDGRLAPDGRREGAIPTSWPALRGDDRAWLGDLVALFARLAASFVAALKAAETSTR
jgi:hypothetical protein